jgi:hypothetical protein
VSHGPHSADKRRYRATTSVPAVVTVQCSRRDLQEMPQPLSRSANSNKEWFCQDGQHELVKLQPSWRR